MKLLHITAITTFAFALISCSESYPVKPAELTSFQQTAAIHQVWSNRVGKGEAKLAVKLQPAIDSNIIYAVSSDGTIMAINTDNGQTRWEVNQHMAFTSGVGEDTNALYIGTNDGKLAKLSKADGSILWTTQVISTIIATPTVQDNVVVIKSINGDLRAFDANSGQPLWTVSQTVPPLTLRDASSVSFYQNTAIAGFANGNLMAVDLKTGTTKWSLPLTQSKGKTDVERMIDIDAEPIIDNHNLYAATYQGDIASLNPDNGSTYWRQALSVYNNLSIDANNIYASDADSYIWAFDQKTGRPIWKQTALKYRQLSGPAVVGEYLVVADKEGYLHIMEKSDGHFVARIKVNSSGISTTPMVNNNELIVLANNGALAAYRIG